MWPTWAHLGPVAPGGSHIGPTNLAIRVALGSQWMPVHTNNFAELWLLMLHVKKSRMKVEKTLLCRWVSSHIVLFFLLTSVTPMLPQQRCLNVLPRTDQLTGQINPAGFQSNKLLRYGLCYWGMWQFCVQNNFLNTCYLVKKTTCHLRFARYYYLLTKLIRIKCNPFFTTSLPWVHLLTKQFIAHHYNFVGKQLYFLFSTLFHSDHTLCFYF